ncbi:hypothetical protein [Nocardia gipuzkoensis]
MLSGSAEHWRAMVIRHEVGIAPKPQAGTSLPEFADVLLSGPDT